MLILGLVVVDSIVVVFCVVSLVIMLGEKQLKSKYGNAEDEKEEHW